MPMMQCMWNFFKSEKQHYSTALCRCQINFILELNYQESSVISVRKKLHACKEVSVFLGKK